MQTRWSLGETVAVILLTSSHVVRESCDLKARLSQSSRTRINIAIGRQACVSAEGDIDVLREPFEPVQIQLIRGERVLSVSK